MTASSLRSHLADVLYNAPLDTQLSPEEVKKQADALLADPPFAAIVDLAEWMDSTPDGGPTAFSTPEVRALLADWRAERLEREAGRSIEKMNETP